MNEPNETAAYVPRSITGIIITTWAVGILIGLAAGKAIWKKPCEHPEIPAWVAYVPTNDLVQIRTNVKRILQEMYDTPGVTVSNLVMKDAELTITNTGSFTMTFPDFPRGSGKWGGQATNSPFAHRLTNSPPKPAIVYPPRAKDAI